MPENEAYVYLHLDGEFVPAGIVTMHQTNRSVTSEFAYGRRYLERPNAIALDPLQLPLTKSEYFTEGVFRAFQDASPDAWGRHLLDRAAEEHGVVPTEFEYLTVQNHDLRIGAIAFGPNLDGPRPIDSTWHTSEAPGERLDFQTMLDAVDRVLEGDRLLPEHKRFLQRGSSIGGAQPKALIEYEGRQWVAKFSREFEAWPTCRIELAAMRLAAKCGIRVPRCKVLTVGERDVFLSERFDRGSDGYRHHFLSAMTLTGANNMQSGSYGEIAMAVRRFGPAAQIQNDLNELFTRMVFNILINNWDDHLRNHGFLYDPKTKNWRLSPAYDIVPQPKSDDNLVGRLTLSIGEYGAVASMENIISRCGDFGLSEGQAISIVDNMITLVSREWKKENLDAGVSEKKIKLLEEAYSFVLSYNIRKI